jgi:hypothetical protein
VFNFKTIITDYETENGEIDGMYREPRGCIYHPHRSEDAAEVALSQSVGIAGECVFSITPCPQFECYKGRGGGELIGG